jgi:hypothetical protein
MMDTQQELTEETRGEIKQLAEELAKGIKTKDPRGFERIVKATNDLGDDVIRGGAAAFIVEIAKAFLSIGVG